jgi:hypothetical protein
VTYKAPFPGRQPLGGEFRITPDGRFLLCKSGTVLRLAAERDFDLQFHLALEPFIDVAVDPTLGFAFVLSREGTLDCYSYPDFKLKASHRLGIVASHVAISGNTGKLLIAGIDPRTVGERPRARGLGDVFVFEVKEVLGGK